MSMSSASKSEPTFVHLLVAKSITYEISKICQVAYQNVKIAFFEIIFESWNMYSNVYWLTWFSGQHFWYEISISWQLAKLIKRKITKYPICSIIFSHSHCAALDNVTMTNNTITLQKYCVLSLKVRILFSFCACGTSPLSLPCRYFLYGMFGRLPGDINVKDVWPVCHFMQQWIKQSTIFDREFQLAGH